MSYSSLELLHVGWVDKFFRRRTKEWREQRYPKKTFENPPRNPARRFELEDKICSKNMGDIIEQYFKKMDESNHRYVWLKHWLPTIRHELEELNRYDLSDVKRVVMIQNDRAIFDFYVFQDIHIEEIEPLIIDLKQNMEDIDYFSGVTSMFNVIFSLGSLGYFLSNIIH
jgi:hypothetical protein